MGLEPTKALARREIKSLVRLPLRSCVRRRRLPSSMVTLLVLVCRSGIEPASIAYRAIALLVSYRHVLVHRRCAAHRTSRMSRECSAAELTTLGLVPPPWIEHGHGGM